MGQAYYHKPGRRNYYSKGGGSYNKPTKRPRFIPPNGWLPQFEAAFDFILNGSGHGAIEAVAGSGKTTCLVESCFRLRKEKPNLDILAIAFNSSIRKELQERMPEGIDVETCHSFNYKSVCRVWGEGKANFDLQNPTGQVAMKLAEAAIGPEASKKDDHQALCQAMSLSKTRLASNEEEVLEVMLRWGIETSLDKKEFARHVLWMMNETKQRPGTVFIKSKAGKQFGKKAITFDDQVWLPIVNNWAPHKKYDIVFIDEAQDLSPARLQVAMRALKEGGRIIAVGDRFQCIYAFAGADIHAFVELTEALNAHQLPLTCSFRCGKNIIKEAQNINPNIHAAPNAIDGIVDSCTDKEMMEKAEVGDAIISRTNAPLVKAFFKLAKSGKRVCMLGRDFGAMLVYRINNWRKVARKEGESFTGNYLLERNDEWLSERLQDLNERNLPTDRATDEHETIRVLSEDLGNSLSSEAAVDEIIERIQTMFSNDEKKEDNAGGNCITLSSTHKFKGLERDRIFMLADTYKSSGGFNGEVDLEDFKNKTPLTDGNEEDNLFYVAVTRAKKHLTYVRGTLKNL